MTVSSTLGIIRLSSGGKVATLPPEVPAERLVISHGEILNTSSIKYNSREDLKQLTTKEKKQLIGM
jgi:hypothetical protein